MSILIILFILTIISLHIPHNSNKYNLSWHTRLLSTLFIIYLIYFIIKQIIN